MTHNKCKKSHGCDGVRLQLHLSLSMWQFAAAWWDFFLPSFFFFFFFSQEAEGNEASRLLKPTSASKLRHVRSVLGDYAYLIHAQHRHGGCPSVLWSSCSGWLGYSTRSSVPYVILSCDISLSRANCTCKRARQAEERPDVHRAVEEA